MLDITNEKSIFIEALKLENAEARSSYLNDVCAGNAPLRSRIEVLLRKNQNAGDFLAHSPADVVGTVQKTAAPEVVGTTIGPYKLLEQIGEGGMGVVYMAEQKKPIRRKVALKVIKPGMDTKQVVARFEAERQALALMDHPNIAKVHDAGATESGRPFFIMELVKGIPITKFCDCRTLDTRLRLELFVTVCGAIQHAHQKGIIHRDIKPNNILVEQHDVTVVPKVIDFGIAKATNQQLTERTLFTNFSQMIGTPLYMSPEQAELRGMDVDTRTDVYSLGVLLYELLTGTTPFDSDSMRDASYDEMRRMIREDEPPKPSDRIGTLTVEALSTISEKHRSDPRKLRQLIHGELDWIAAKAMEKDRNRRYESPSALAADVQRYLDGDSVHACPPSATYRFRKYARRHKAQLLTVATITAVLVIATMVSSSLAAWAVREQGIAQTHMVGARRNERIAKRERAEALDSRALAEKQEQLAKLQRDAADYDAT